MSASGRDDTETTRIDLYEADERYHFKLSDILRKRHRPLLLIIDDQAEPLYSSAPQEAPALDEYLLEQAIEEVKTLFHSEFKAANVVRQLVVEKPGERCALILLEKQFYSLRLFPLQPSFDGLRDNQYAALIEPIVKPIAEGIDFAKAKATFRLSNREVDVLKALMSGDTDKEIARTLDLGAETVRGYLKSIRAKVGVSTRTAIVHRVYELSNVASSARI